MALLTALVLSQATLPVAGAAGLVINPTFDTTAIANAGFNVTDVENAFNMAASQYAKTFTDPIHVNIEVTTGNTGLGESESYLYDVGSYTAMKNALTADNTHSPTTAGTSSVHSLPSTDPTGGGTFWVTTAEAKALGLMSDNTTQSDGTFIFSNSQSYTYNNTAAPGKYDLVGVAEHEIAEIMGRIALLGATVGSTTRSYSADDLFRFSSSGVRSFSTTASGVYLSANNGSTKPAVFNSGAGDRGDYNGAVASDPYNASTGPNQAHSFTQADITNMDIIGYNVASTQTSGTTTSSGQTSTSTSGAQATPEPSTLTLLGMAGLTGLGYFGWGRRKAKTAA